MPELPEVETIRRTLSKHVLGLKIKDIKIIWPSIVVGWQNFSFKDIVINRRIKSLERRGKYLLITLDEGWSLIAHMRMTGRLIYYADSKPPETHTHAVFVLERGELHFSDVRKFGRIQAIPTSERYKAASLSKLGPEPLEDEFTPGVLKKRLEGKKINLKGALLDQRVLAGLGNIYADEALFRALLSPRRVAGSLTEQEIERLHRAIREVLSEGVSAQGTSFRDYRDANGDRGSFQLSLRVYGRAGHPCRRCGKTLERIRLAGRSTVFCPDCQKN